MYKDGNGASISKICIETGISRPKMERFISIIKKEVK
jgi:hypothetical protein